MYVVGHSVGGTVEVPEISFDMVGTTGNLYKTVIGKVPSCDCPDAMKGNQCKHIFYGMFLIRISPDHYGQPIICHSYLFLFPGTDGMYSAGECAESTRTPAVPASFPFRRKFGTPSE
jgi:hypothetical protein